MCDAWCHACSNLNSFHAGALSCLEQTNMNAPEQLNSSADIELGKNRQEGVDIEIEVLPNGMRDLNHTKYKLLIHLCCHHALCLGS